MGKSTPDGNASGARRRARTVKAAPEPGARPTPAVGDRIRPTVRLADLHGGREPGEALPEAVESSGFRERPAAYRVSIDTVRANLRLPAGQPTSTAVAASAVSMPMADRLPKAEGGNDVASATPIASAHDLGRLVRAARERRGLSQQAFADLVGVGRRFISELENGKTTLELGKVLQVASATGIDLLARRRR